MAPLPMFAPPKEEDDACCGPKPGPRSSPFERPGYRIEPFVENFVTTPAGPVPRIKTRLKSRDRLGTLGVRLGFRRNNYRVAPGLYALGHPDPESNVLVTANYKLSFDILRRAMAGLNAWLLVLDTRGINVWCAAGKKTFSSEELVNQIKTSHLEQVVSHRKLILPQLSATGVSAQEVKRGSGFEVLWGPIKARDIKAYLAAKNRAHKAMRLVTFTLTERVVLTPVEFTQTLKSLLWVLPLLLILSGIGPHIFSLAQVWHRGIWAALAIALGVISGTILTPIFLPWLPFRAFYLKGALAGLVSGLPLVLPGTMPLVFMPTLALLLLIVALSSYLAMNFTGCTPYTSPSGVEKEMRRAIPLQAAAAALALILWVGSAFFQPLVT